MLKNLTYRLLYEVVHSCIFKFLNDCNITIVKLRSLTVTRLNISFYYIICHRIFLNCLNINKQIDIFKDLHELLLHRTRKNSKLLYCMVTDTTIWHTLFLSYTWSTARLTIRCRVCRRPCTE